MKRQLLFALAMLFAAVGFAQKDITDKYITNAKLDQGTVEIINNKTTKTLTGWTVQNFNNSQQGSNTQGWASESYAGWGNLDVSQYSLTQTIKLPVGSYRLVNYSFFRQGLNYDSEAEKSLAYLKAGDQQVAVKTLGSITGVGSYANSQSEGANVFDSKMYRNVVEFEIVGEETEIEIGLVGTFDLKQSWIICGMFELFDLNDLASVSSPTDVTYAITNPGFEYRNLTGWTNGITKGNNQYATNNNFSSKVGIGFYESWQSGVALGDAGTFTQTLSDMPAGLYELSVYAQNIEQYNNNKGGTGMFLTANGDKTEIGANGQYKVRTTLATDGDLTIGISLEGCTGNWIAWDRFELQFYGDPLVAYQDLLDEVVAEAQELVNSGTLNTGGADALQTVINDNDNDDKTFTEEAQFNEAISNIEAAMATANEIATAYAAWTTAATKLADGDYAAISALTQSLTTTVEDATTAAAITAATAELKAAMDNFDEYNVLRPAIQALYDIDEYEELTTGAHDDLGTALTASLDGVTSANDIASICEALREAGETYTANANPTNENNPFDLTFMLTNPDITDFWDGEVDDAQSGTWGVAPAGWYTDQVGGNFQVMANAGMAPGEIFIEYWSENAATSGFMLYQKVTLPEGTYQMTGRLGAAQYDANGSKTAITFSANDVDGTALVYGPLQDCSLEFVNKTAGTEVQIGMKAHEGNNNRWVGINKIHLYKVPTMAFVIDEAETYDNTQSGAGNVTLKRTIKEGINTVVLPFALTDEDIVTLGGEGAEAYTVSEFNPETEEFTLSEPLTEVLANTPFFLKATQAGTEFTFEDKTIVAGEPSTTVEDVFTLVGNYEVTKEVPVSTIDEKYYIVSDGNFYNVDGGGVTIKNTRFYVQIVVPKVAINETETYDNTQAYKYANITLTRTIKANMNTVVLPFELTAEDIEYLGGEDAVAYTVSAYANDNLTFTIAEAVPANTPFFLKATEAGTEFTFLNKKVEAGIPEAVTPDGACSLLGSYEATFPVPESDAMQTAYILSGGQFYKVDSPVTIRNTRFYVLVDGEHNANTLGFTFIDGEANAINGIASETAAPEGIYNLQGQKVEKATKGIYIINGKKVLVK